MSRRRKPSTPTPPKPPNLHWGWRVGLAVVGMGFIVFALIWWANPPDRDQFAPQATSKDEFTSLPGASETVTVLLIAGGVVLFVLAANGRRLSSFTAGDWGLGWAEDAAEGAGEKAKTKAKARSMSNKQVESAARIARGQAYIETLQAGPLEVNLDTIADAAVEAARAMPE
jgi:hypothetical protein